MQTQEYDFHINNHNEIMYIENKLWINETHKIAVMP